jgi:hypothetical protein
MGPGAILFGDCRALFEIEQPNRVVVYRIRHRRDAYRK